MSEKLRLLESVFGEGHKANRDYYQFNCPFCNHHKPKLGVSLGTGKWKCWVCGANGKKVTVLLHKLAANPSLIARAKALFVETYQSKKEVNDTLSLPPEFKPLWEKGTGLYYNKALKYLLGRGLTTLDLFKHRIGYCDSGKYRDMVVFPFYDEMGTLVYFTGRSYLQNPVFKFAAPTAVEKDRIYDEDQINWSEPIILVESKLDAIVVRRNAIPLNGKQISRSLFNKILEENVSVIYLCLDGDAVKDAMKYSKWFNEHGIEVYITEFPIDEEATKREGHTVYHDPTSLGHEKVWEYIDNAKKVTETENLRYMLLRKLNK
jgi:ribosomal protein L37AE/L43A